VLEDLGVALGEDLLLELAEAARFRQAGRRRQVLLQLARRLLDDGESQPRDVLGLVLLDPAVRRGRGLPIERALAHLALGLALAILLGELRLGVSRALLGGRTIRRHLRQLLLELDYPLLQRSGVGRLLALLEGRPLRRQTVRGFAGATHNPSARGPRKWGKLEVSVRTVISNKVI